MKVKHNKKRNVGLLFAQLSQLVSESMVEGDANRANKTLTLIKKHFVPKSELFKEFRLFRAIMVTSVPTDSLASSIISEAKTASKNINMKLLTQQKSALIKDINYELNEGNFYNRRVTDYKTFATVQTLLSEWRSESPDLSVIGKFEPELHYHLLREKKIKDLEELKSTDVNYLVVDIMRKKIEEKFRAQLNSGQLSLLKEYVFSNNDKDSFLKKLVSIKSSTISTLDKFEKACNNKIIESQIPQVRKSVASLSVENVDDETISRYLTLMKITEELTTGEETNG
tara:strand:- start:339 stop:1190 length:852 start_codon:yes stop_codon:yes gene_type:complete